MATPPLPPRPDKPKQEEIPHENLLERTLIEQEAGRESLKISQDRHRSEIEAGKKLLELNQQRAKKVTIDSEAG